MTQWFHPKTPPALTKGYLVIHSDDGKKGDYEWFNLFKRKNKEYSSWNKRTFVQFCPSINTGDLGIESRLTKAQVAEIHKHGYEILSHGDKHFGLAKYTLTAAVSGGTTIIPTLAWERFGKGYNYIITDGVNIETVKVIGTSSGSVTIEAPLLNAYAIAGTLIWMTETSAKEMLNKAINYLAQMGIECKHHVFTWHDTHPDAITWVSQIFESARGSGEKVITPTDTENKHKISSILTYGTRTNEWIDTQLNLINNTGGVAFFYGHGEVDANSLIKLEYLIDGAVQRGIKIINHSEAIKLMTDWGVVTP